MMSKHMSQTWSNGTRFSYVFALLALVAASMCPTIASADRILVLDFELNDLTLYPNVDQEMTRVAMLRPLLVDELEVRFNHDTPLQPASAPIEAAKGHGYIFDRPKIAARLGREVNADWVLTGRLHKASHLFVYLKAQLIDVQSDKMVFDFVVELKGWGKKLTQKGVETLALQIQAAIDELPENGI